MRESRAYAGACFENNAPYVSGAPEQVCRDITSLPTTARPIVVETFMNTEMYAA